MNENQAVWYLPGPDNQPTGPHTTEQVQQWCREGKLNRNTLCWRDGMNNWVPLADVQAFLEVLPPIIYPVAEAEPDAQEFDDISKVFGKAMSLTKRKAKTVSLKMSINKHEKRKSQVLLELGKMLYEKESDSELLKQSPYIEKINQAGAEDESIQQLRKEIETIESAGRVNPKSENP
jgi:hypothetical protein